MATPKSARKRTMPHQFHGMYALERALDPLIQRPDWLQHLGEIGEALRQWQHAIVTDLGGEENLSSMERSIIEMATKTHLFLASVDRFLLEQPCLVNRSRRQLFPVVLQRQQLADALSRYMSQLGLKPRARPVPSLTDYLAMKRDEPTDGKQSFAKPSAVTLSPLTQSSYRSNQHLTLPSPPCNRPLAYRVAANSTLKSLQPRNLGMMESKR